MQMVLGDRFDPGGNLALWLDRAKPCFRASSLPLKSPRTAATLGDPSPLPSIRSTGSRVVKALKAGDVRFSVEMITDQLGRPVNETEATNQY